MKKVRTLLIVFCMALTLMLGAAVPVFAGPAGPQGGSSTAPPSSTSIDDYWLTIYTIVMGIL